MPLLSRAKRTVSSCHLVLLSSCHLLALVCSTIFIWASTQPALAGRAVEDLAFAPIGDVAPGCIDLIEGGNFEQFSPSWLPQPGLRPAMYTSEQTFNSSLQAMRVGNGLELPNVDSISEVRYKPLLLPYGANRLILRFLYYPLYEAAPGVDVQQVDLFDATTDQIILSLLNVQEDDRRWKVRDYDLTAYAGRSVSVRFRVRNDGDLGRTLIYIDNVELEYCAQTPIPTHTSLPTATATGSPVPSTTPVPTAGTIVPTTPATVVTSPPPTIAPPPTVDASCVNTLGDGGFEGPGGWIFGEDPVPPRFATDQRVDGTASVLLGNPPGGPNVITFSSVRRLVTFPYSAGRIELRWSWLLHTEQTGTPGPNIDRQDLILLSPQLQVIKILRRELRNSNAWQQDVVDLTAYRGQTLYIYFNAFNDSNNARTWLYLDAVQLNVCGGVSPASIATTPPLPTAYTPSATTMADLPSSTPLPTEKPTVAPTLTFTPLPPTALPTPTETWTPLPVPTTPPTTATPAAQAIVSARATATSNLLPLATLPPTDLITTPTTLEGGQILQATPSPIVISTRPAWLNRLGPFSILIGFMSALLLLIWLIARSLSRGNAP